MKQILVDTNILINLISEASVHHERAKEDVKKLLDAGHELFVCPQVLRECYKVMTASKPAGSISSDAEKGNGLGLTPERAHQEIQDIVDSYEITQDSNESFVKWRALVSTYSVKGKNVHDTHIVACMLVSGIDNLLTYNPKDFKRFNTFITVHS